MSTVIVYAARGKMSNAMCVLQIMIIVFGQQLPDAKAGLPAQLFGVAAASTGLASFALVLALVEQVCVHAPSQAFVCTVDSTYLHCTWFRLLGNDTM